MRRQSYLLKRDGPRDLPAVTKEAKEPNLGDRARDVWLNVREFPVDLGRGLRERFSKDEPDAAEEEPDAAALLEEAARLRAEADDLAAELLLRTSGGEDLNWHIYLLQSLPVPATLAEPRGGDTARRRSYCPGRPALVRH